jgi:prevent-host-death family protein
MKTVGLRALKENLSKVLNEVKSGERVVVTDRKKQVALIVPLGADREDDKLLDLMRSRAVHWSGGKPAGIRSRIRVRGGKVSESVLEDRR